MEAEHVGDGGVRNKLLCKTKTEVRRYGPKSHRYAE